MDISKIGTEFKIYKSSGEKDMPLYLRSCSVIATFAVCSAASAVDIPVAPGESINTAITTAGNGDVIVLSAGTYLEGSPIDTLGKTIQILGTVTSGEPTSILDGGSTHQLIICSTPGSSGPATFTNLRLQNGRIKADGGNGGAMSISNGCSPFVTNCLFFGNNAVSGGAVHISGTNSVPSFSSCSFTGNSAENGGALMVEGGGGVVMIDSHFTANIASPGPGGAVVIAESNGNFGNCVFSGNTANLGGTFYVDNGLSQTVQWILNDSTICGSTEPQISGEYSLQGAGNCIKLSCALCNNLGSTECPADLNGDGAVDGQDLTMVLSAWGVKCD